MTNASSQHGIHLFGVEIEDKMLMKILALIGIATAAAMSSEVAKESWTFRTAPVERPYATGLIKHDKSYTDSRYPVPLRHTEDNKKPAAE